MGKIIALVVAAAAAYYTYTTYFYKSPSLLVYERFLNALYTANCGEMQGMVEGSAKDYVDQFCAVPHGPSDSTGQVALSMPSGAEMRFRRQVESETSGGDTVTLVVRQSIVGVTTPINGWGAPRRHTVKVRKNGGTYVLTSFVDAPAS